MKKSAFIEIERLKILALLREARAPLPVIALTLAEVSASSAEASGMQWETEEPELPARVSVDRCGAVAHADGSPLRADEWSAWRDAAVRTYNAWGPKGEKRKCLALLADHLSIGDARIGHLGCCSRSVVMAHLRSLRDEGGNDDQAKGGAR